MYAVVFMLLFRVVRVYIILLVSNPEYLVVEYKKIFIINNVFHTELYDIMEL